MSSKPHHASKATEPVANLPIFDNIRLCLAQKVSSHLLNELSVLPFEKVSAMANSGSN